jgi:hypothetical protein
MPPQKNTGPATKTTYSYLKTRTGSIPVMKLVDEDEDNELTRIAMMGIETDEKPKAAKTSGGVRVLPTTALPKKPLYDSDDKLTREDKAKTTNSTAGVGRGVTTSAASGRGVTTWIRTNPSIKTTNSAPHAKFTAPAKLPRRGVEVEEMVVEEMSEESIVPVEKLLEKNPSKSSVVEETPKNPWADQMKKPAPINRGSSNIYNSTEPNPFGVVLRKTGYMMPGDNGGFVPLMNARDPSDEKGVNTNPLGWGLNQTGGPAPDQPPPKKENTGAAQWGYRKNRPPLEPRAKPPEKKEEKPPATTPYPVDNSTDRVELFDYDNDRSFFPNAKSVRLPPPPQSLAPVSNPQAEKDESKYCKICFEKEVECVLDPCGHTACWECAAPFKICPFCRNTVGRKIRMYFM